MFSFFDAMIGVLCWCCVVYVIQTMGGAYDCILKLNLGRPQEGRHFVFVFVWLERDQSHDFGGGVALGGVGGGLACKLDLCIVCC